MDKRRAAGRLLALRIRSDWHYPACQFRDAKTLPGIPETLAAMADASGWSVLSFLLAPDDALAGRTPLNLLRDGDMPPLRRLLTARTADAFS